MRPANPDLAALPGHIGFLLRQRLLLGLALGLDDPAPELALHAAIGGAHHGRDAGTLPGPRL